MSVEWILGLMCSVVAVILLQITIRVRRNVRFDRRGLLFGFLSMLCATLYYYFEGGQPGALRDAPFGHKVALTLAILFAFFAIWRALLWMSSLRSRSELQLPPFVLRLFGWVLFAVVAVLATHQIFGVKLTGVLITSTVASAVVGLSLQSLLANLFAGIALQLEGHFSVGDWVQVGSHEGKILRRDWRSISLLSLDEELLILPNTLMAKEVIVNHSLPQPVLRLDEVISIDMAHPPMAVKECMLSVLSSVPEVLSVPAPSIHIGGFGEIGVEYKVRFWINQLDQRSFIRDAVLTRMWYALSREEMDVALSTQIAEVRLEPQQKREMKHEADARAINQCLENTGLFGHEEGQLQLLAEAAALHRFAPGEYLVKQGDDGDSLMVIESGEVGIYARNDQGISVKVDTRDKNEFFGEMSLLTGEPRSASAKAECETSVVVIGKKAFAEVLSADPAILSRLLDALETRRSNLISRLAAATSQESAPEASQRSRLLHNISRFLGIKLD